MSKLLYFDIESTGLDVYKSKILSITLLTDTNQKTILVNPGISITNSHIHGITNEMVENKKPFCEYAKDIQRILESCDCYVGYNLRKYDVPLLKIEMLRCGIETPDKPIIDVYEQVQSLYKSLKLSDIYRTIFNEDFKAHNSYDDVVATKRLYEWIIQNKLDL